MNIIKQIAKAISRFVKIKNYEYIPYQVQCNIIRYCLENIRYDLRLANGMPVNTVSADGHNQVTHPKIIINSDLAIPKYIMGVTAYPFTNAKFENPELLASSDGISFTPMIANAIDVPDDVNNGGHNSDIHVTFKEKEIYVFYRYNPAKIGSIRHKADNYNNRVFYRCSLDGKNWTERKVLFSQSTFDDSYRYFSPVINYTGSIFKIWFTNNGGKLIYLETTDLKTFSEPIECNFTNSNVVIWHQDIVETDRGFEILCCGWEKEDGCYEKQNIYTAISKDGIHFSELELVMKPSNNGFDSQSLYRPTFYKHEGIYYVYYAAYDRKEEWHIGLSCGLSLNRLVGYQYFLKEV